MSDIHIAMDWAQSTFAIAWDDGKGMGEVFESKDGIKAVKSFLNSLSGTKRMTFEEGTASQWLFTEIRPLVDELIVCNTRRNHLLSEGAKNDRIDALKLLKLLKADLLKPVYHTFNKSIELRKLVSCYSDFVRAGVRLKNQKSAILRSIGEDKKSEPKKEFKVEKLLLSTLEEQIEVIDKHQKMMKQEFKKVREQNEDVGLLASIPGIGEVNSVRILAAVVDANRFTNKGAFLSYAGLVKHERSSGGIVYGHKSTSYHRGLRQAFKTAALICTQEGKQNYFTEYYEYKLKQGMPAHDARNATARRIATVTLGVLKCKKRFSEKKLKPFS